MPLLRLPARAVALALLVYAGAGCAGESATGVERTSASLLQPVTGADGTTLLQCEPAAEPQSVSGIIGPLGGTLSIGGTRVVIPEDAVLAPTNFTLTIPASRLVEISVRAGTAEHFFFERPVLVSIDYGRCASQLSPLDPVTAWHIDESTKALLENMSGVDLRPFHTITFLTGHLSGYAVAD